MESIILIAVTVVLVLLVLMFVASKFLTREQSYEAALEMKKQELESVTSEQKSGKQKRKHVFSKHNDKQKSGDEKQKPADDKPKSVDDKPKPSEHKQKEGNGKPKVSDDREYSSDEKQNLDRRQKLSDDGTKKSDAPSKVDKKGALPKSDTSSNSSPAKKHVEIVPTAETIDPEETVAMIPVTPEKILSSRPSRSILTNKDEKSLVIETDSVPETFHPRPAPVDELDRKEIARRMSGTTLQGNVEHLKEAEENQQSPSGKSNNKKKKKGKANEANEDFGEKPISFSAAQQSNGKSGLESTRNRDKNDVQDLVSSVLIMLDGNEIAETDCQSLMKALEAKGVSSSVSSKKSVEDDVALEMLKRRVTDLETSLQKEKSTSATSNLQVKKLREELTSEHQKSEEMAKNHQAALAKQSLDIKDQRSRLEMMSKVQDQERKQFQTRLESLQLEVVEHSHTIQAVREENRKLKETICLAEQQLIEEKATKKAGILRDANLANTDVFQQHLEDNIKKFENQFEEMVAKQEMEKVKEENEALIHELRNQIEGLKAEIVEKDKKVELFSCTRVNENLTEQPVVCERTSLTGSQSYTSTVDGLTTNDAREELLKSDTFSDAKVKDLEDQLRQQKEKNDDLRRKNWKTIEALSELESELQKTRQSKPKLDSSEAGDRLKGELQSVKREKENLSKLNEEKVKLIKSLECQIADLQKHSERRHVQNDVQHDAKHSGHDVDLLKLEESLNRQIQKNDDLRRRNWKVVEALNEMEKRVEDNVVLKSQFEEKLAKFAEVEEQLKSLKKENADYAALKMAKASSDGLNDSQLKRIAQLEAFITQKNAQIKRLEDELLAAQDLTQEKSKSLESLHHMRQALKEKDVAIEQLRAQLKNSSTAQSAVPAQNSVEEVLLKKNSEIEHLKSELLRYQSKVNNSEMLDGLPQSSTTHQEIITENAREQNDSNSERHVKKDEHEKTAADVKSLQDQVKHYQDVLSDTAGMLSRLQSSVEQEENKWRQKFEAAEERTAQAQDEAEQLRNELQSLKQSL